MSPVRVATLGHNPRHERLLHSQPSAQAACARKDASTCHVGSHARVSVFVEHQRRAGVLDCRMRVARERRAGERRRASVDGGPLRRVCAQRRTLCRHALKTCARPMSRCFISSWHAAATLCVMRWHPRLAGGRVICTWAQRGVVMAIAWPIRVALCASVRHVSVKLYRRRCARAALPAALLCLLSRRRLVKVARTAALWAHGSDGAAVAFPCAFALRVRFVCGNLERRLEAHHRAGRCFAGGALVSRAALQPDLA